MGRQRGGMLGGTGPAPPVMGVSCCYIQIIMRLWALCTEELFDKSPRHWLTGCKWLTTISNSSEKIQDVLNKKNWPWDSFNLVSPWSYALFYITYFIECLKSEYHMSIYLFWPIRWTNFNWKEDNPCVTNYFPSQFPCLQQPLTTATPPRKAA